MKWWKPIKKKGAKLAISHLFFADDLLFFTEATEEKKNCMRNVLQLFGENSGQQVNDPKKNVVFSKNVFTDLRRKICHMKVLLRVKKWVCTWVSR